MFDAVQVRALAGPLKDIQSLVPKPLQRCLGYVLRVIVLLEGEPSPQSEVLSVLELNNIPTAEKHPHSMMLPPPCFTVGVVPGFFQMWLLAFRPKSFILVSSDQRILFLMV
jgi:hypothetical protein